MILYNTMTRSKEELQTLEPKKVRLYTCGLTVYSQPHVGNWVSYIYWDVLVRALRADGYTVKRVQNITDVGHLVSDDDAGEDKMEKGARAEGVTAWEVADKYITVAANEAAELGLLKPDELVRATDLIQEQIEFVKTLEDKGFTYIIEDGVYFDTSKLSNYGKLARLDIEGLQAGARVEIGGKKSPTDFALWKLSPTDQKRDMEWPSPWGVGFPGWHLECSVIARHELGNQIDIHTGGIDHIPVHHTNEIAQTEAVTGKPFSKLWMHSNHMKINGTKISKSLGNTYTLEDIKSRGYSLAAFKLMVLSKHYRTEGNFTWEILEAAQNRLNNWDEIISLSCYAGGSDCRSVEASNNKRQELVDSLLDDLNTPAALKIIDEWIGLYRSCLDKDYPATKISDDIRDSVSNLLGIELARRPSNPIEYRGESMSIGDIVKKRDELKANKDYAEADNIRNLLADYRIAIYDTSHGTWWGYKS